MAGRRLLVWTAMVLLAAVLVDGADLPCCSDKYGSVIDIQELPPLQFNGTEATTFHLLGCANSTYRSPCGAFVAACETDTSGGGAKDLADLAGSWMSSTVARFSPINPGTGKYTEVRVLFVCDPGRPESSIVDVDVIPDFFDQVHVTLYNVTVASPLSGVCGGHNRTCGVAPPPPPSPPADDGGGGDWSVVQIILVAAASIVGGSIFLVCCAVCLLVAILSVVVLTGFLIRRGRYERV